MLRQSCQKQACEHHESSGPDVRPVGPHHVRQQWRQSLLRTLRTVRQNQRLFNRRTQLTNCGVRRVKPAQISGCVRIQGLEHRHILQRDAFKSTQIIEAIHWVGTTHPERHASFQIGTEQWSRPVIKTVWCGRDGVSEVKGKNNM